MTPKTLLSILICLSIISFGGACKEKQVSASKEIIVLIEAPTMSYFMHGKPIEFEGSGETFDGSVAEDNLQWTSSIDGVIGTGTYVTRDDLSPGTHEIELSAVNEDGDIFTDITTIEIQQREEQKRTVRKKGKRRYTAKKKEKWFRRIVDPLDGGIYIEVYNGTIVDMSTGLMWEMSPDNSQRNFQSAVKYARSLRLGGYKDWRVPTIQELRMISNISFSPQYRRLFRISDEAVVHSAAISNVFETMNGHFWAVEATRPYVVIANRRYGHSVQYQFDFTVNAFRGTYTPHNFSKPGYIRCVRNANVKKWRRVLAKSK